MLSHIQSRRDNRLLVSNTSNSAIWSHPLKGSPQNVKIHMNKMITISSFKRQENIYCVFKKTCTALLILTSKKVLNIFKCIKTTSICLHNCVCINFIQIILKSIAKQHFSMQVTGNAYEHEVWPWLFMKKWLLSMLVLGILMLMQMEFRGWLSWCWCMHHLLCSCAVLLSKYSDNFGTF